MTAGLRRHVVIDGSALVALLGDGGPAGAWVATVTAGAVFSAPDLAVFEAANIFRRQVLHGALDETSATLAHADLVALPLRLWPYAPLAERTWELRHHLTAYDGSYVALAEMLEATVVTLDARLAAAPGPRCQVLAFGPPGTSPSR